MTTLRTAALTAAAASFACPVASASPTTKEQCVEAHGRGQDAREQGKLTLARTLFLACAQPVCPPLVQGDCARFADDLLRQQSSVTFAARDAQGVDLPATAVYVDDKLVVGRLDDGRPHELDPGKHVVRFRHGAVDRTVTVVVGAGEKARAVVATFATINPPRPTGPPAIAVRATEVTTRHPSGARVVIAGGVVAVVGGLAVAAYGLHEVPSGCSLSTHHCAAPPGDPAYERARSGTLLFDVGLAVGAVGVAAIGGGLAWYYLKSHREPTERRVVTPVVTRDGAGLVLGGSF